MERNKDKNEDRDEILTEDDGRTVADMSGVEKRTLFGGLISPAGKKKDPDPGDPLPTKEERMAYLKGVVMAVLLVTGIFIVVIGLVILALQLYWNGMSALH